MAQPAEHPLPDPKGEDEAAAALPVGEVAETDWQEWEDSVAFQDSQMSEFVLDDDSLTGDANAIVVEISPADSEHFDPFAPQAPTKP